MRKTFAALTLALSLTAFGCEEPQTSEVIVPDALLAAWDYKVTGGGVGEVGSRYIEILMSVTDATDEKGWVKGQVEYIVYPGFDLTAEPTLKFHGTVDDFLFGMVDGKPSVNVCGTVDEQIGDWPENQEGRFGISIVDDPNGDLVRQNSLYIDCATLYDQGVAGFAAWPATMTQGDFRIKSDN